ncbi:MAG: DNA mismatch repair protein MutS [Comamonadaceae bacterium]|nr:MAG: DNA mismatch repair protein MutS [Comamonadaceae bacterium]
MKITQLSDLQRIRDKLAAQEALRVAAEAARLAAERKARAESELFVRAAGNVKPLPDKRRARIDKALPPPIPVQSQLDEQAVLLESISDEFDVTTLLDTDDALSFRRPGIGADVTRKLRKGEWTIQRQVDLHGLRREEAREALGAFIRECTRAGLRCVRVIHGKGLGSPGKEPVLKAKVQGWLIQKNEVMAFVQAKPTQGGAGALVVLLNPV